MTVSFRILPKSLFIYHPDATQSELLTASLNRPEINDRNQTSRTDTFYSDSSIAADLDAYKMQRAAAACGVIVLSWRMGRSGHLRFPLHATGRTYAYNNISTKHTTLITQHNDKSK
jgi:hypothetical protein